MSNSIAPGSSADVNVKVTALTTNPNVPVTYKTIILKKNLVNGVNTLTQEMMSATNTKYVIKYDYVLGEDVTVPVNCILEFDGGSINETYTLTGNNTGIQAKLVKIFNTYVNLAGTWNIQSAYSEWFGISNGDEIKDTIDKLFILSNHVVIQNGSFLITDSIILHDNNILEGGYNTLFTAYNSSDNVYIPIIFILGDNCTVRNIKVNGGSNLNVTPIINKRKVGIFAGNHLNGNKNIIVENCEIYNCTSYGIVSKGENILIQDNYVHDCAITYNGLTQTAGISVGYHYEADVKSINIRCINNKVENCYTLFIRHVNGTSYIIEGNCCKDSKFSGIGGGSTHCIIKNNTIVNTVDNGIDLQKAEYCIIEGNYIESAGTRGTNPYSISSIASGIFFGDDYNEGQSGYNKIINNTIIGNQDYNGTFFVSEKRTCGRGIYSQHDHDSIINGNTIIGIANLRTEGEEQSAGICCIDMRNVTVTNNTIKQICGNGLTASIQSTNGSDYDSKYNNNKISSITNIPINIKYADGGGICTEVKNNSIIAKDGNSCGINFYYNLGGISLTKWIVTGNYIQGIKNNDFYGIKIGVSSGVSNDIEIRGTVVFKNFLRNILDDHSLKFEGNHTLNFGQRGAISDAVIFQSYICYSDIPGVYGYRRVEGLPASYLKSTVNTNDTPMFGTIVPLSDGTIKVYTTNGWKTINVS